MDLLYTLFLLAFLIFPFAGLVLGKYLSINENLFSIKLIGAFFFFQNALFFLGFSIKGDYTDYLTFSLEYLFLCYLTFELQSKNLYLKILKGAGLTGISLGIITGAIGIFLFPVVSQDYEADKIYDFKAGSKSYQTRRFSFGTVGSMDTWYSFDTYRQNIYLPFETKIDKTAFFSSETRLNIERIRIQIYIQPVNNKQMLSFRDTEGNVFTKTLD